MLHKTGSYVGNGERKFVDLGFTPRCVIAKADSTQYMALYMDDMWCGRSNVLGGSSSYISGIRPTENGFIVGSAAALNTDGMTVHFLAIGDDGSEDFEIQSWAGNQTAGREITLQTGLTPIATIIKRDGPRQAAFKVGANPTITMQGQAIAECIEFGAGKVTLAAVNEVNEWDSAGGLGEGIDGIFFSDSSNFKTVTWVGDGTTGRIIPTGLAAPSAAIISNPAVGGSSRLLTDTMGGKVGPVTNGAALLANEASFSGGNIVIIAASPLNISGQIYGAVVFANKVSPVVQKAPAVRKMRGKQGIFLSGETGSYIACGTSDATLDIDGAMTYEWFGAHYFNPTSGSIVDGVVCARGSGPYGNALGYSWSFLLGAPNDGALGWDGPQYCPQTHTIMGLSVPLNTNNWRTGILAKFGQVDHVVASIGSDGECFLLVNGILVKQRKNPLAVIASVAGHETTIGCRKSGASYVRNTKLMMRELSIYNRALTLDEAYNRYCRTALGSTSASDVTSGLAERWSADNAGTSKLVAVVNAANNGTINGGKIVTF